MRGSEWGWTEKEVAGSKLILASLVVFDDHLSLLHFAS
jgi:hypothetical protein